MCMNTRTMSPEIMVNLHGSKSKKIREETASDCLPDIHCELFSDTVTKCVCVLRRQELNHRGSFSCDGCKWDKETWNRCS